MTKKKIFWFRISRDFEALKKVFTRAIRQAYKSSELKAIYVYPENTTKKCSSLFCLSKQPGKEKTKARFNLVFEYPYLEKKNCYSVDLCFECVYEQLKRYFEDRLKELEKVRKDE